MYVLSFFQTVLSEEAYSVSYCYLFLDSEYLGICFKATVKIKFFLHQVSKELLNVNYFLSQETNRLAQPVTFKIHHLHFNFLMSFIHQNPQDLLVHFVV